MSARALGLVWERSRAKGSNLLVLLAVADQANDNGKKFWGSNDYLREKSRLSERSLFYILKKLRRDGEIVIEANVDAELPPKSRGFIPERWIHVRCVFDWDAYQVEGAAKFAVGGKSRGPQALRHSTAVSGSDRDQKLQSPNRKDLSVDPSVDLKAAALTHRHPQPPELATYKQLQALVGEALEFGTFETVADLSDAVKTRASRLSFVYEPEVVARAISSVTLLRGFNQNVATRRDTDARQQRRSAR